MSRVKVIIDAACTVYDPHQRECDGALCCGICENFVRCLVESRRKCPRAKGEIFCQFLASKIDKLTKMIIRSGVEVKVNMLSGSVLDHVEIRVIHESSEGSRCGSTTK